MDNFKRELVIQLWKRRGPFWEAVKDVRQRWSVSAQTNLPEKCKVIALLPPGLNRADTPDKRRTYAKWCAQLSNIAAEIVPETLHGGREAYHKEVTDWEPFMSACVLFDPPDAKLETFAKLGPFLDADAASAQGALAFSSPPISKMHDVAEVRTIEAEAWDAAVNAIFELYVKPMGLTLDKMWKQVHACHPEILENRQERFWNLRTRTYIEVNEHTTWDEVKNAFKILSEGREVQPKRGRSKRDRLQCMECAILHDQHKWSYEQLAGRYGWLDYTLASKYIKDGRKILQEP